MRRSDAAHMAAATSAWGAFILRTGLSMLASRPPTSSISRFRRQLLDTRFIEALCAPCVPWARTSTRRSSTRRLESARYDAPARVRAARRAAARVRARRRRASRRWSAPESDPQALLRLRGEIDPDRQVSRRERTEAGSLGGGALTRLALLGRGKLDLDDGARAPVVACARPFTSSSCSRSRGRRRARGRRRRRACCRASPCPR